MQRNTYRTAARVTAAGALKFDGCCGLVPVKSTVAERFSRSTVTLTATRHPGGFRRKLAAVQDVDQARARFLRVVLHVLHVGLHELEPETVHHALDLAHAAAAGGDLRLEVGDVQVRVAGGVPAPAEHAPDPCLVEASVAHQQEVVDQDAFLLDGVRVGRHRPGRLAADVGVVAARGDVEQWFLAPTDVHRRHHRDIGQVGATVVGVVQHVDVAGPHFSISRDHGAHARRHGTQVHRHVRCIGDQRTGRIEQRAGKVQPLLDIDARGGPLERDAHLFGDRHEQVIEDFQHHRVGIGPDGVLSPQPHDALQQQFARVAERGAPAGAPTTGPFASGSRSTTTSLPCLKPKRTSTFVFVWALPDPKRRSLHPLPPRKCINSPTGTPG